MKTEIETETENGRKDSQQQVWQRQKRQIHITMLHESHQQHTTQLSGYHTGFTHYERLVSTTAIAIIFVFVAIVVGYMIVIVLLIIILKENVYCQLIQQ